MLKKFFTYIFCILCVLCSSAQNHISTGTVIDSLNKEKLAFVNIIIRNDNNKGFISDMNGNFKVESNKDTLELIFSYVGYKTTICAIKAGSENNIIQMVPAKIELAEVKIYPGENPAHRIINKTIENMYINNPEKRKSFSCNIYNKMYFTIDPESFIKKDSAKSDTFLDNIKYLTDKQYLFLSESFIEKKFLYPDKTFENVIASKVSGVENPLLSLLMNQLQPFTFYDEIINISDKKYINPLCKGSTSKYFFLLEDTIYSGIDTVYIISFKPKRNKKFDALTGLLYINTNTYAIQNVIAEPADKQAKGLQIKIQQQYKYINNQQWFPVELAVELRMNIPALNNIKLLGKGKSYVSDINLNPDLKKNDFNAVLMNIEPDAINKPEKEWNKLRVENLDLKDLNTYRIIDSIGKSIKLDKKTKNLESMMNGEQQLKCFNLHLDNVLKYNLYEGFRAGIDLCTNDKISSLFSLGGYVAYGFADKEFKYGGNIKFFINKKSDFFVNLSYSNDIAETGSFSFFKLNHNFNYDMYREFLLDRFDKCDNYTASVQFRSLKYAIFNISGETSHNTPLYNYKFGTLDEKVVIYTRSFDVDALSLGIRYAYGEKIFKNGNFVYTTSSNFPVIWFKYTRGLTGIINGEYEFDRILFRFDKSFYIKYLGKPSIRIDMGYVNGNLPLFLLFSSKASYRFFNLDVPYTFATARINEFTCDRFLSVYFQHDFGKLIFGRGKFSPSPVLISSFGLGTINNKENHLNVNIKTMEKGFFESGIMINSLLSTGICNMGIGGYYRYGYYGYSNFIDNLSIRVSITFPFLQ